MISEIHNILPSRFSFVVAINISGLNQRDVTDRTWPADHSQRLEMLVP